MLDRTSTADKLLILHEVGSPLAQTPCSKHLPGAPFTYKTTNIFGARLFACDGCGKNGFIADHPDGVIVDFDGGRDDPPIADMSLDIAMTPGSYFVSPHLDRHT